VVLPAKEFPKWDTALKMGGFKDGYGPLGRYIFTGYLKIWEFVLLGWSPKDALKGIHQTVME